MTNDAVSVSRLELKNGKGQFVIHPLHWGAEDGRNLLLLSGPNGSGKTTLLNVLSGHVTPTQGHAHLYGECVSCGGVAHATRLGVLRGFQTPLFCHELSVWENISLPIFRFSTERVDTLRAGVFEMASEIGLEHLLDRWPFELSFGEKRMVELLRLQFQLQRSKPRLLLLDEPLAGLDGSRRPLAIAMLIEIATSKVPTILVEHGVRASELSELSPVAAQLRLVAESEAQFEYHKSENFTCAS